MLIKEKINLKANYIFPLFGSKLKSKRPISSPFLKITKSASVAYSRSLFNFSSDGARGVASVGMISLTPKT